MNDPGTHARGIFTPPLSEGPTQSGPTFYLSQRDPHEDPHEDPHKWTHTSPQLGGPTQREGGTHFSTHTWETGNHTSPESGGPTPFNMGDNVS